MYICGPIFLLKTSLPQSFPGSLWLVSKATGHLNHRRVCEGTTLDQYHFVAMLGDVIPASTTSPPCSTAERPPASLPTYPYCQHSDSCLGPRIRDGFLSPFTTHLPGASYQQVLGGRSCALLMFPQLLTCLPKPSPWAFLFTRRPVGPDASRGGRTVG